MTLQHTTSFGLKNQKDKNTKLSTVIEVEKKEVCYCEYSGGHKVFHKIDFDSPRTFKAALQLGITFDDCLNKYKKIIIK